MEGDIANVVRGGSWSDRNDIVSMGVKQLALKSDNACQLAYDGIVGLLFV